MAIVQDVETVYNKNREELDKVNITINNFEVFIDRLDSFVSQFDETIKGSNFRAADIKKKLDLSEKTVSKVDWEGTNVFRNMYKDSEKMNSEFQLQNDYRRQWIEFYIVGLKKLEELLRNIRQEYDDVAIVKAEKHIVDEKFADIKKEISEKIDSIEKNLSEELKVETKKIIDILSIKTIDYQQIHATPTIQKEETKIDDIVEYNVVNIPQISVIPAPKNQRDMLKEGYLNLITTGNFDNLGDLMKKLNMGPNYDKNHGALRGVIRQLIFEGLLPENHKMGQKLVVKEGD